MRENIWKNIKLGFKTNKLAVAGAAAIILLALISIFAFLYPVDPNAISATERLNAPSMAHLFGTDDMGRDYLARCIYGGRASLLVGFLSMVLSTALGVIIGSISGFVGGTVDAVLMRLVDALMSLPTFLIMIVMNAFLKPGLQNIVLIIGIVALVGIGGGAYYYIKFVRGKKQKDEDLDFFDDEGYEEEPYINEDEEPVIADDADDEAETKETEETI